MDGGFISAATINHDEEPCVYGTAANYGDDFTPSLALVPLPEAGQCTIRWEISNSMVLRSSYNFYPDD